MLVNSAIEKKELHELIDKLPKAKYKEVAKLLWELSIPEVEPTEEEKEAIEQARKEIENGEYVTLDELYKAIYGDEKE